MKKLSLFSLISLFLVTTITISSPYSTTLYYDSDYESDYYYDYNYDLDYDLYYDKYYHDSYYDSYYSKYKKEKELYAQEKKAEQAYKDARIAKLKAKLARLKYQDAPRYIIIKVERELKDAIYDRFPNLHENSIRAKEFLIAAGIVFIIAGLLD